MNLYVILENLGFIPDVLIDEHQDGALEAQRILETEIELHQQPNYPLKGRVENAKVDEEGRVLFAAGEATQYGSRSAWEE